MTDSTTTTPTLSERLATLIAGLGNLPAEAAEVAKVLADLAAIVSEISTAIGR